MMQVKSIDMLRHSVYIAHTIHMYRLLATLAAQEYIPTYLLMQEKLMNPLLHKYSRLQACLTRQTIVGYLHWGMNPESTLLNNTIIATSQRGRLGCS